MSLRTTPKGLLAALAALCIILLQIPGAMGSVAHAATHVDAPRAAVPASHVIASHATVRPHTQTVGSSTPMSFTVTATNPNGTTSTNTRLGSSAAISPTAGPVGTPFIVSGILTDTRSLTGTNLVITVTVTDAAGNAAFIGTTTTITPSGAFALSAVLPFTTAVGNATVTAVSVLSDTAALRTATAAIGTFTVNQPVVTFTPNLGVVLNCITASVGLTNVAPGVPITPTLVYSSTSGVTKTQALALTTVTTSMSPTIPITGGTVNAGNITGTVTLPSDIANGTTGAFSLTATYPITPVGGFPTFTAGTTTLSVSPVAPVVNTLTTPAGPLGPNFIVGVADTLGVNGTGFLPNSAIALTIGLSGTTAAALNTGGAVTTDATGAFTSTQTFTPSVAGTYVVTAAGVNGCNVAVATFTVIPGAVPGAPVSTIYFPEGYTGNGNPSYVETLDLLNPNVSTVIVTNTYFIETTNEDITTTTASPDVVVVTHTLPALADISVNVQADIASQPVSSGPDAGKGLSGFGAKVATRVQTAGFLGTGGLATLGGVVRGVAAERIMERSSNGARLDGDVSLGETSPNTSYYFAEGYTGRGFQEYLILLNPSSTTPATVTVFRTPEGSASAEAPLISGLVLAPLQRLTLNINRYNSAMTTSPTAAENKIGLIVNSDPLGAPIAAERVSYNGPGNGSGKPGETISAGLSTAAKQLNFAYGSLTAVAPDVVSTITPTSDLAQTIDDRPFIEVANPNIAGQIVAGTLSGSAAAGGPAAHITIQLRTENGRLLGFFFTDVDAGARFTLSYNDLTGGSSGIAFPGVPLAAPTRAGVFSAVVSSSERVVSELSQYYGLQTLSTTPALTVTGPSGDAGSGAPGLTLTGAPSGETNVLFPALGTTDPASAQPLSQTVFLYNPGIDTIRVNGTYFGPAGVLAHYVYQIGADSIVAIGQTTSSSGGVTSAVTSTIPAGTTGAEFTTVQQRGATQSGEPGQTPETFVAAAVTHSADGTNWWGTQGFYPLPVSPLCSTTTGQPLGPGCP